MTSKKVIIYYGHYFIIFFAQRQHNDEKFTFTQIFYGRGVDSLLYSIDLGEMPPLVRDFASYKSAIQNCSVKTVSEYLLDLRTFFRFLIADRQGISPESEEFVKIDISGLDLEFMKSVSTEDIYGFLMYSGTVRQNMWSAKARKLSAVKAFFKFLTVKRKLLEVNPAIDIEAPKPKKSLPKVLTVEEAKLLLDAVRDDKESKSSVRDYAIITLFLNCGMRVSELVGIDLSDIDHELRSVRVVGKGNKERIVYLNDACRFAIGDYISERLQSDQSHITTKALFLSKRDQRISVKTVQWMVYKYLDLAGLGSKHYSVHKLRHTAATLMYQSGNVDVRVLKDILGHEQLNTTQIYTHISNESMEKAMEQNPLSGISRRDGDGKISD